MNIQNKVLIGVACTVGMMLLVLWIAVNEPVRMEVFTQQWAGRSIERGAEIFLNNCQSCHGVDGLGLAGVAPALKNPMLFLDANPGKIAQDKLSGLTKQKTDLESALKAFNDNRTKREEVNTKLASVTKGSDEEKTLQKELEDLDKAIATFDPKTEEKIAALDKDIATQQAEVDLMIATGWDVTRDVRTKELAWTGSLQDYLRSTLISGRPSSAQYWPRPMPAWGQQAGGPLRQDEIDNLVNYLMNYASDAKKLTPNDLRQQFKRVSEAGAGPASDKVVVGKDVDVTTLDLTGGNAEAGKAKYTQYGCVGCHGPGGAYYSIAPVEGTYARAETVRLPDFKTKDAKFANYTAAQYIAHSITHPNEYIIPNGPANIMPQNFGDQLDVTDLKDIIAYLETVK